MTSVLLVRLSAMGDLVQSLGAVPSLRAVEPDAHVTVVTQQEWLPLLRGVAGVDAAVGFDRWGGLGGLWRVRRALRARRYDWALDLQGNWKSALVARLSGAVRRVGMWAPWRQEPRSRVLLTETLRCEAAPHPARAAWELVRRVAPDAPFATARLTADESELERERRALQAVGVDADRAFRVLVVTDPADPRALRPAFVARLLAEAELPTVSLFGPDERELPAAGEHSLRHGRGDVRRLVALGALLARAGGDVIGPDQGATHVLLAAGATGRVVFGSQDPRRTAPATATATLRFGELACRPCRARRCRNPDGVVCMPDDPDELREVAVGLPEVGARGGRAP